MPEVEFWEHPEAEPLYMILGWRQWADAGSVSSGLPPYLVQHTAARKIGQLPGDSFYLFQIPGTHDLVRPVVRFQDGYPQSLESRRNELYYTVQQGRGVVLFIGDEPHLNIEGYVNAILDAAETLGVKRIISLGGVYGELPFDKERAVHGIYSLPRMKPEMDNLAVGLSDYHGGASVGSYLCKRAGERGLEFVGLYAFVPTYDFSSFAQRGTTIRIENDYLAWLGVMRRINYMLKTGFSLDDLEHKTDDLIRAVNAKVDELEGTSPQLHVREYMQRLSEAFVETPFDPLDDVWESELRRLLDDDANGDEF